MPFAALGLSPHLAQAATAQGYTAPTPIQTQAIPAILQGHDLLALAQTGSGKTAAFALPLLHQLAQTSASSQRPGKTPVQTLILVPTRELAAQVGESLSTLARQTPAPLKISVVFGGVSINTQMMGLRGGAHLVVATPGRLLDLIDRNALTLGQVNTLVLDEADRLLDLGFADELSRLLALLPRQRQTLFFSATFPKAVQALADGLLHQPMRIDIAAPPAEQAAITQRAIEVDAPQRTQLLRHLIQQHRWTRVLVFVATKFAAEIVADKLRKANIQAEPFHGVLSQGKRSQVLTDFKASKVQVVVATDLAARGIDIASLPVVVNFDLPRSSVDYLHRIGRTGRAGETGLAVSFISADTQAHFRLIEKRQGLTVAREQIAGFEPQAQAVPLTATDPTGTGGIKGKRPSKKDRLRAAAQAHQKE
jgi:ATP-dependent RNA helicase RhlE